MKVLCSKNRQPILKEWDLTKFSKNLAVLTKDTQEGTGIFWWIPRDKDFNSCGRHWRMVQRLSILALDNRSEVGEGWGENKN